MGNRKILFRIPLTIYWLCWDKDVKKFLLATKCFDANLFPETNGYYIKYV